MIHPSDLRFDGRRGVESDRAHKRYTIFVPNNAGAFVDERKGKRINKFPQVLRLSAS
jgi:hypothetical protein